MLRGAGSQEYDDASQASQIRFTEEVRGKARTANQMQTRPAECGDDRFTRNWYNRVVSVQPGRCHVIACTTVIEEMLPLMPKGVSYQKLELGLHAYPDRLRAELQRAIDAADADASAAAETILLGYGLCSRAVAGLKSARHTLVVPRIDDCIGIFLGSAAEYDRQHQNEPGSLYLTKGWIEAGAPFNGHEELVHRWGREKADMIQARMLKNYTRLVFIRTGNGDVEEYRKRSQTAAARLNLRFEEIQGSGEFINRMVSGPWDIDFVVTPPGREISFLDFRKS